MHSRWRSKSNTLNSMEREMGRCPTRKHASKKRPILFLNTNGVAFNPVVKIGILYIVQVAWFGHMTRVMPQNHRHLQPFGGLLRILHSGEFKKFLGKPLKYAPFVILSVWQSEPINLQECFWLETPPQMSSLLIGKCCPRQISLSARAKAGEVNILVALWDETGWWGWSGWGTILEDGDLYWFRFVGKHGLWRDLFFGGNLGSSRTGNSFKIQDGILSKEDHQQRVAIINHMTWWITIPKMIDEEPNRIC